MVFGYGGEKDICEYCENVKCNRKNKPRILECNRYVMRFIYAFIDGVHEYPNGGAWDNQPSWFMTLFDIGMSEISKIRKQQREKKNGNSKARL